MDQEGTRDNKELTVTGEKPERVRVQADEVGEVTRNHTVQGLMVPHHYFGFYSKCAGKPLEDLCRREIFSFPNILL